MLPKLMFLLCAVAPASLLAQGSQEDYERANGYRELTKNKVHRDRVRPNWIDAEHFWYRVDTAPDAHEFMLVNADEGTRRPAFDHRQLAEGLSAASGQDISATKLPFERIELTDSSVRFSFAGKDWSCDLGSFQVTPRDVIKKQAPNDQLPDSKPEARRARRRSGKVSPDGQFEAFVKNHNVFVREGDGEAVALSDTGTEENSFVERFWWSPDSRRLVAMQRSVGEPRIVHLIESSPKDQLQPKLHEMEYAKPGDQLPESRPCLFDVTSRKQIQVSNLLFSKPWRISDLRWQPDSSRFTFLYNQRGHQVLRVVVVDGGTGEVAALVDETSKTFIDYAYKRYSHFVDAANELIWMSERDGWNHLYLYDTRTGHVKNQITRGPWVIRGVERVDPDARRIWFRASGVYPEQDPYYIHHGFVDFDGGNLTFLTQGNGTHRIEYSPDRRYFLDTYSRVDLPTVTELRRSHDGSLVCELEQGDWSRLRAAGWRPPKRFTAKGRDGTTDIFGVIYLPSTFDEQARYPVIEKIYAGPHGSFVPKDFRSYRQAQSYAELGFIVVQIDGMGTSNRSKAFHDVCWKNLGDSGFPDRILWMQAAAREIPQMDLNRVGIFGGSAGGQSALRALLAHGDFYKVAVADCGCHDNRMDKVWWNELWMGWPIGEHYAEQSNVTQAHRLQGKLFLTVGELDRNVDPASTMQVVDALIKANKDFDLLVVPGAGHGVGESTYANRRRQDFFVRHLLGVEPRQSTQEIALGSAPQGEPSAH